MSYDKLKLSNQLCFPVYAASRLIIREYQPHLDKLGITYPQYLVLMVLWENDGLSVNKIAQKLILNTNTITPLLKRMENMELIQRKRSTGDERKVVVTLTEKGSSMKNEAVCIPENLIQNISSGNLDINELIALKSSLHGLIDHLQKKQNDNV